MKKELAGQPVWLWAAGAGVILLGYLYFRSHSSASSGQPSAGTPGGGGKSSATSTWKEWLVQHNAPSHTHKRKAA